VFPVLINFVSRFLAAKLSDAPVDTSTVSSPVSKKRLTEETMSPRLRKMEYAVRGKVVIKADEISEHLSKHDTDYPFDHIVYTNIGNPHSVGQKPLTWPRQVIALVELPDEVGVDHPDAEKIFPPDAIRRAKEIKAGLKGMGTGAYTHSKGAKCFREDIAKFIEERDGGVPCDPEDIFMTNGASEGIGMVLQALMADSTWCVLEVVYCRWCETEVSVVVSHILLRCHSGCMIPIPQYPIYSATIDLLGGHKVGYYLNEKHGWDLNLKELERSLLEAKDKGINVNSFVLINPGNPTGQVLPKKEVQDIVRFCAKHNLVLLADEVYQVRINSMPMPFTSFSLIYAITLMSAPKTLTVCILILSFPARCRTTYTARMLSSKAASVRRTKLVC
jgi:aspartate/methionine/tyrosine aminotransferase